MFVPRGQISNIPAFPDGQHQAIIWTNDGKLTDAYMHH